MIKIMTLRMGNDPKDTAELHVDEKTKDFMLIYKGAYLQQIDGRRYFGIINKMVRRMENWERNT